MQPPAISYGHYKSGRKSNHSTVVDTEVNKSIIAQERHVVTPPTVILFLPLMAILKMLAQPKNVPNMKSQ